MRRKRKNNIFPYRYIFILRWFLTCPSENNNLLDTYKDITHGEIRMESPTLNINKVIDEAKFAPFHWKVLFWCLLIIIFDGYDLIIYGVALPLLMEEWSLTAVQAGFLASAALFGMMFGAMIFGTSHKFTGDYSAFCPRTLMSSLSAKATAL